MFIHNPILSTHSVLCPTDPNRKHTALVTVSEVYLKVLLLCPLLIHFLHLNCPSSSCLHLEIYQFFKATTSLRKFFWIILRTFLPLLFPFAALLFSYHMAHTLSSFLIVFLLIEKLFIFVVTTKCCPEWELNDPSLSE